MGSRGLVRTVWAGILMVADYQSIRNKARIRPVYDDIHKVEYKSLASGREKQLLKYWILWQIGNGGMISR